jgi:hypothetical protein
MPASVDLPAPPFESSDPAAARAWAAAFDRADGPDLRSEAGPGLAEGAPT